VEAWILMGEVWDREKGENNTHAQMQQIYDDLQYQRYKQLNEKHV
jgi:hypothetical protein